MLFGEADQFLWDIFGYPAYRVIVPYRGRIKWSDRKTPGFYWTKIATDDVPTLHALCEAGFKVVDVGVTLIREPVEHAFVSSPVEIEIATPGYYSSLLSIAEQFECSRFHRDPDIPRETANRIKRAWLGNYFSGHRGDEVFVALNGDRPAGFLAVLSDGTTKVIDLIAVDTGERRKGIGKWLIRALSILHPCCRVRVGTQISNTASMRLYESCGFKVVKSEYILHAHSQARDRLTDPDFENMMR